MISRVFLITWEEKKMSISFFKHPPTNEKLTTWVWVWVCIHFIEVSRQISVSTIQTVCN